MSNFDAPKDKKTLSDHERAELHSVLGLGSGGKPKALGSMEWSMWSAEGAKSIPVGRRVVRLGRIDAQRIELDARRRMEPLREALLTARRFPSEDAWVRAMAELAQVALDAEYPERAAANLLSAASVDPRTLPLAAAQELQRVLAMERAFAPEINPDQKNSVHDDDSPRAKRLDLLWSVLLERAFSSS